MSGIGACPWDGSQVGLVIGWPFSQSLISPPSLHICTDRINLRWKVLWVVWCLSLLHWGSCLPTGGIFFRFQWSESQLRSPSLILWCLPYPKSLSCPGDAPPTSSALSVADFHSFSWPFSHLLSFPTPDTELLPISPLSKFPPSFFLLWLFSSPLLIEIQASLPVPFSLFSFVGSVMYSMVPLFYD